jgi:DNA-binding response OmpR family regulator
VSAVVLDVHLPDMDGFEVCRASARGARHRAAAGGAPVGRLRRNEDRVTGLNAGADSYMVHPVEPAVLVATAAGADPRAHRRRQLRRSEQRLRAIYDQAQSGIALLDAQGRFSDANPAMLHMLGRTRER